MARSKQPQTKRTLGQNQPDKHKLAVPPDAPLYINRELSLLEFFRRVLEEAKDESNPLVASTNSDKGNHRPTHLRSVYRCETHFEDPKACPKGQIISTYPVAFALIGLVEDLVKDKMRLSEALEVAAKQYSNGEAQQQLEIATKAELQKTVAAIQRVTQSIAEDVITESEARNVLQELRDKKERLTRKLQGLNENKTIKAEILEAVKYISCDLGSALWAMLEKHPRTFTCSQTALQTT